MSTPADESLIRDADLKEAVEHARGTLTFRAVVGFNVTRQRERDAEKAKADARKAELAAMPREMRRRSIVREVFENSAPTPAELRHIHSVLAVCGLPYDRQPIEVRDFERRQGRMSLLVKAGEVMTPSGEWKQMPLPFGPKARLILMHLCSEAVLRKSATIELAETFTAFVRELGFADNAGRGGALTAFREQLNALAACELKLGTWTGQTARTKSFKPIEDFEVWLSDNPAQRSLWPSTVTFSADMFESLKRHAVPINVRAVRAFAGSARKLDLYFWLGYRLKNVEEPVHISWQALGEQFGTGFGRKRDFQRQLADDLRHIQEVFPKLPAQLSEHGLKLEACAPLALGLPSVR